jgi:hypothetical protein
MARELASLTGASERTARRWIATGRMPAALALAVSLLASGDLGTVWPEWRGWRIVRGELTSPEGWTFRPGEIAALPLLEAAHREAQRALAEPAQWSLALETQQQVAAPHPPDGHTAPVLGERKALP